MLIGHSNKKTSPSVSIILLTYNGMPKVEKSLAMLFRQDYHPSVEIIHIDSGSTDGTLDITASHGIQTHRIRQVEFQHSRTRNIAAIMANNDILVFLSQDAIPTNTQWLSNLLEPFTDSSIGGVYGRQIPPETIGDLRRFALQQIYPSEREIRSLKDYNRSGIGLFRFSNANSAVRADLCRRFKFDERALVCEDHGMCRDILKAGFKIVYEPNAAVIHGHERTLWGEFKWAFYNGCSLSRMGILNRHSIKSEMGYGKMRLKAEWNYFIKKGMYRTAFLGFIISVLRWHGVQIGKGEDKIPNCIRQRLFSDFK